MLSLFKNKKETVRDNVIQDRVAKNIVTWCIHWQQRWASFMQKQTERLSGNGKMIMLSLFCLITGSLSIYLFTSNLLGKPSAAIPVIRIKTALSSGKSGDENTRSIISITKHEYQRIKSFSDYMDSLARSPSGKLVYQAIIAHRLGLMDSIALVEKIYLSQSKK